MELLYVAFGCIFFWIIHCRRSLHSVYCAPQVANCLFSISSLVWTLLKHWRSGFYCLLSLPPRICSRNYFRSFRILKFLGTWQDSNYFCNPVWFSVAGNHYKQDNYEGWGSNIQTGTILSRIFDTEYIYLQNTIQDPNFHCVHVRRYLTSSEMSSVGLLSKICCSFWGRGGELDHCDEVSAVHFVLLQ